MNLDYVEGLAKQTDPETSHAAAASMDASSLMLLVYETMSYYGDRGCIGDDIENDLSDITYRTVSPRFKQMVNAGMIEETGEKRMGVAGRLQNVRRVLPPPFAKPLSYPSRLEQVTRLLKAFPESGSFADISAWNLIRKKLLGC